MKKALLRNLLMTVFFAALPVLFGSCARAQETSGSDLSRAFSEAGLPLLKEPVSIRDFSLPRASQEENAEPFSLSGLKGKVVFLNFWASWCGPCREEMPSMEALYNQYRDKGLEIIAVNIQESNEQVLAFMKTNGLSFPAALDSDGKVSATYGIQAIPASFIIDREGKIIARKVGSINWNTPKVRAAMERVLN